ncbi:MAG TPA: hypothetical protein VF463_07585 [Sphingobium sp.]
MSPQAGQREVEDGVAELAEQFHASAIFWADTIDDPTNAKTDNDSDQSGGKKHVGPHAFSTLNIRGTISQSIDNKQQDEDG